MKLENIFRRKIKQLYIEHGPQGWWPRLIKHPKGLISVDHFPNPKLNWLLKGDQLEVWEVMIGAILTQNVAWENVEQALLNMAQANVLKPEQIIKCHISKLGRLVRPARYYGQKAKKLKIAAEWLLSHAEFISASQSERSRNKFGMTLRHELLSLWGVGPETADTILAYGFNLPVFVVDIYTRRLFYHLSGDASWMTKDYEEIKNFCEKALLAKPNKKLPLGKGDKGDLLQEAHALIVRWGKSFRQSSHRA